ncbi:DUF2922 domain-containing protein [Psychrobacillus sp. FSL H8-0483]|uniref:DUF2922 domain-containing protein n=1 Tax=Psychrobacillus sp. FSL H8-0483 TaxID=2921389 RepID=UPI00315B0EC0
MAKTLQLQFGTTAGKSVMLTVEEPKDSLTRDEIETGMEVIITSNVFQVDGAALTSIKSAKVVERNISEII